MLTVVIIFLALAILLYFLLGGADFGAGIIELFTSRRNKERTRATMYQAIGPIWEANHMWVIIAVVILFVGFPEIYSKMCTYLHIPILALLLGIIARGTAFTFRNYDAIKGERTQALYNSIFVYSSFLTPLFLGIIAGSAISRKIDFEATDFMTAYIYSWCNWFSIAVGLFTVALCGFLAAIYLVGEATEENEVKRFIRKAKVLNAVAVFCGGLVFVAAETSGIPMAQWIFGNVVSLSAVMAASASLVLLWIVVAGGHRQLPRIFAAFQVSMILLSVGFTHFPNFLMEKNGHNLSLISTHANMKTIETLGTALLLGSLFILPALGYLYYSFRGRQNEQH
ncbi:cytochrome d ubiquinol oxidase subunit II [Mucilaginibacter antarcticus]|uniref:Cytochrome d ubiquinol oxidase subunit II n=1 Tax=Mucilaginibacter antarcticus TaxID=1855725 RepID=A0ABW5XTW0_9SPHI